jgi:peptide/nickel transport system substrate-binding protein
MKRRSLLAASLAAPVLGRLSAPAIAAAPGSTVLKVIPSANLTSFDPIFTTAYITRNHAFMIYDTLYGLNAALEPVPQMAAGHTIDDDGLTVTITLRDGQKFHDGEPVRASDAVASLRRWMKRSAFGQKLDAATNELTALDDKRFRFRLKKRFPTLFDALASVPNTTFVMPERVAATDPYKQITETIGSGPFRFKRDEFNSGNLAVYERNPDYVPRPDGETSLTAGPKRVFFDRIEWHIVPDAATAGAALQRGEVDWWEQPTPDLRPLLARDKALVVEAIDNAGSQGILRLNHLHPPFDNKALRRALLPAVSQADFMQAVAGTDPDDWHDGIGVFARGTPMANSAGLEPLTGPRDVGLAKRLMKEAGYDGQRMRLIGPTDYLAQTAETLVSADLFNRLGFNQDVAISDWGTVVQRRTSREPVEKGGWSAMCLAPTSFDLLDPAVNGTLRANGLAAFPGWPSVPALEALNDSWFDAPDLARRKAIAADIQRVAMEEVVYIPLGWFKNFTALRRDLTDRVRGFAIYWNVRRA